VLNQAQVWARSRLESITCNAKMIGIKDQKPSEITRINLLVKQSGMPALSKENGVKPYAALDSNM
jgi:hypothetical protein